MSVELLKDLLPLVILGIFPVLMLLVTAFKRSQTLMFAMTVAGLGMAFVSLFFSGDGASGENEFLVMDDFGRYFTGLLIVAGLFVALFSYQFFYRAKDRMEEYYILLVTATFGSTVLAASVHFIALFMGLEVLSVSLYTLIAYTRTKPVGIEAGIKYLVLAAASSAFLLLGMALVYFVAGTMAFSGLAAVSVELSSPVAIAGAAMLVAGIGFKLALVPFHFWTPDVYQGAPAPVTALIASISKGGMFAVFLRFFSGMDYLSIDQLVTVFVVIAILSMLAGNLLALLQKNVKRMLAYSSIGHLGYILIAFLSLDSNGAQAATFYLSAYAITILGAFGIVALLSDSEHEADNLADYAGLYWKKPWLAVAFTVVLLSLAGIPLTIGFMGKYYLLLSGIGSERWLLAFVLVISSVVGLFYYLRVIVTMLGAAREESTKQSTGFALTNHFALTAATVGIILIGVYPTWLMDLIRSMIVF